MIPLVVVSDTLDERPNSEIRQAFGRSLALYRELSIRSSFDESDQCNYLDALVSFAEFEYENNSPAHKDHLTELTILRAKIHQSADIQNWLRTVDERIEAISKGKH